MKTTVSLVRTAQGSLLGAALAACTIWSCSSGVPDAGDGGGGSGSGGGAQGTSTSSSGTAGSGSGSGGAGSGASSGSSGSSSGSPVSSGGSGGSSSGGSSGSGSGGSSGTGSSNGSSGGSGSSSSGGGSGSSSGGLSASGAAFSSDRFILTGVRNLATPAVTQVVQLHNGGQVPTQVTKLSISGTDQAFFQIVGPPALPAMLAAGADMAVTIQLMTASTTLPPAPSNKDLGSTLLQSTLTATMSSGSANASLYGLVLIQSNWEPTLGQILITLGYKLNVGMAQNNWNPNTSMNALNLPGIEANTDEVAASRFVKAATGNVTMSVVARFSPVGVLPYGWYPLTSSTTRNVVGTMSMITDPQTSDKARMVNPPLAPMSATTFDPGSAPFGIWVYSDQKTQKYATGNAVNGDYDFTQDALNSPANVHRVKTYPLKDAAGVSIPQSYLVAVEEAGNGDYQDYVFLLGNVTAMP
ncbi:MAG: hypothetical protein M3O46_22730 [Myxococcota bacterium]|nr:hypothetical protein [Myxococcota bacterium]